MKNSITATMEFYFKGEKIELTAIVDLDDLMQKHNAIPPFYSLLAQLNNIDTYSYEYEVMEQEEICFSNPQGLAHDFIHNGHFDSENFAEKWREMNILDAIKTIVKQNMNLDNLKQIPGLEQTLLEVYRLNNR